MRLYAGVAWRRVSSDLESQLSCTTPNPVAGGGACSRWATPVGAVERSEAAIFPRPLSLKRKIKRSQASPAPTKPSGSKHPRHEFRGNPEPCLFSLCQASNQPRILAPLPTTTPESARLCALPMASIVSLPLPISGRAWRPVHERRNSPSIGLQCLWHWHSHVMAGCARIPSGMPGSFRSGPPTLCNPSPYLLGGRR